MDPFCFNYIGGSSPNNAYTQFWQDQLNNLSMIQAQQQFNDNATIIENQQISSYQTLDSFLSITVLSSFGCSAHFGRGVL